MPVYQAPIRDFQFVLHDVLNVFQYSNLPGFESVTPELVDTLLHEASRFCEEVLLPINQSGDKEGCKYDNGKVTMPAGFKEAYHTYVQSGWPSFSCDTNYGGQGLPEVVGLPLIEMICSSNLSFGLTPGLSHGAYNAIHTHASEELKRLYLPRMVDGTWTGVMCLTESHCGTDLGLIRTKAVPGEGGSYKITGSKIFISSGEHDLTDNIIHLVLAKLPDAPEGVKGISLFLVPKIHVNPDGSLGQPNHVQCGSIEHKMGIHGSSTCVMNYEDATGYLVGEPHKGLRAMFTMMNEARLWVGVQGQGIAEVAYQNARHYARERLQGRALTGAKYPDKPADPIIVHPDIRRMLLTMKAFTEGARVLEMTAALKVDMKKRHPENEVREAADDYMQMMTPIIKAYFTDMGFECANLAVQIYGGHGYIREYGVEQFARDARIAQIYEGTNGIQALDLVGRKLPKSMGKYLRQFFHPATAFVEEHRNNEKMAEFTKPLYKVIDSLQKASLYVGVNAMSNPDEAGVASVEYLRLFALAVMAHIWADMARIAQKKLEEGTTEEAFYQGKIATARFYMNKILPHQYGLLASITTGAKPVMQMEEAWF